MEIKKSNFVVYHGYTLFGFLSKENPYLNLEQLAREIPEHVEAHKRLSDNDPDSPIYARECERFRERSRIIGSSMYAMYDVKWPAALQEPRWTELLRILGPQGYIVSITKAPEPELQANDVLAYVYIRQGPKQEDAYHMGFVVHPGPFDTIYRIHDMLAVNL